MSEPTAPEPGTASTPSNPGAAPSGPARTGRPGRLGVGVISAGRVGAVLGSALRSVDHQLIGVHALSQASRERAEMLLPGVPLLEVEEIVRRAELVLFAVPDDELAGLVSGLADLGAWQMGQIVVHTSGRHGVSILAPAQAAGAIPIALHPAMTFTGWSTDLARLTGCPMAVTAPPAFLPVGQALAVELGGEPFVLTEEARPAYHAALSHGADHLALVVAQAVRALAAAGVEDGAGTLRPLLTAALDGVLAGGESALAGAVTSGDAETVTSHLTALKALRDEDGRPLDDVVTAYRTLTAVTVDRRETTGLLREDQVRALREALG